LVLINSFLNIFCAKYGACSKTISAEGLAILEAYPWPGNVRQLKNLVEKLVVLSDGEEISAAEINENLERLAFFKQIGTK
ncbi:MAG: hypothetical protein WCK49_06550, partial [Myxococcaceae bacterium]